MSPPVHWTGGAPNGAPFVTPAGQIVAHTFEMGIGALQDAGLYRIMYAFHVDQEDVNSSATVVVYWVDAGGVEQSYNDPLGLGTGTHKSAGGRMCGGTEIDYGGENVPSPGTGSCRVVVTVDNSLGTQDVHIDGEIRLP